MKLLFGIAALAALANAHPHDDDGPTPNRPKSKDSKIAVVGGGIGGIYTAYKLSKLGYKNIDVFEKSDRLGGKSQTLRMSGHHLDLGTYHWTSASYDWIYATAEELNLPLYNYVLEPSFFSIYEAEIPLPASAHAAFGTSMNLLKLLEHPILQGEAQMLAKLEDYKVALKSMFTYSNDQYIWPDMTTDAQMAHLGNLTYDQWLRDNDLYELFPFAEYINTNFLYGRTVSVNAFHGLVWTHPGMIEMLITRNYGTYVPYTGFQGFVETMALDQKLHVIYNAQINRIIRKNGNSGRCQDDDCVVITYKTKAMKNEVTKKYDFLVNAIHPVYYNKRAFKMTKQEADMFDLSRWESNRLQLSVSMPNAQNLATYESFDKNFYFRDQLAEFNGKYDVVLCLNRKIVIPQGQLVRADTGSGEDCATATAWNYDKRMPEFLTCYTEKFQVPIWEEGRSDGVADGEVFNPEVSAEMESLTAGSLDMKAEDIRYQHQREYFNRYTFENIAAGYPIKLFNYNLENNRNTWFVGSYVSHESTSRITDQIELLLERSGVKERVEERPNFKDKMFVGKVYNIAPGHDGNHF